MVFLKWFFMHLPMRAAAAATGSSMVLLWDAVAALRPNGMSLLAECYVISLPAASAGCAALMQAHFKWCDDLPQLLFDLCPQQPAMMAYLVRQWVSHKRPDDIRRFIATIEQKKILREVRAGMRDLVWSRSGQSVEVWRAGLGVIGRPEAGSGSMWQAHRAEAGQRA